MAFKVQIMLNLSKALLYWFIPSFGFRSLTKSTDLIECQRKDATAPRCL